MGVVSVVGVVSLVGVRDSAIATVPTLLTMLTNPPHSQCSPNSPALQNAYNLQKGFTKQRVLARTVCDVSVVHETKKAQTVLFCTAVPELTK